MISTVVPWVGYGNNLPTLICNEEDSIDALAAVAPLWTANFCSFVFDFAARRKVQGTHMNLFILEQLPVITRADYERRFGDTTADDLVRDHVLRLCYTAYDLQSFAQSQDYDGEPFRWDVEERR